MTRKLANKAKANMQSALKALCILLLFSSCRGCCPVEEWTIVSNTHGEIKKIMLWDLAASDPFYKYYIGVIRTMPEHTVVSLHYTLEADATTLWRISQYDTSALIAPNFNELLRLNMDTSDYLNLKTDFPDIDFSQFADSSYSIFKSLSPQRKEQFNNAVEQRVSKFIRAGLLDSLPQARIPEIVVAIDYNGDLVHYAQPTGDESGDHDLDEGADYQWYVQDVCQARQKFCRDTKIDLLYSTEEQMYENSVIRITQNPNLNYISKTATAIAYTKFDGGNFLPSANYTLVGRDFFYYNQGRDAAITEEILKDQLKDLFKVDHIIPTGIVNRTRLADGNPYSYGVQPIYHLDFFLTPAGITPTGENLIFRGYVYEDLYSDPLTEEQRDIIKNMNDLIDTTVNNLIKYQQAHSSELPKFKFEPLPLILRFSGNMVNGYSSYNNAVVEITSRKRVYMPTYVEKFADFTRAQSEAKAKFIEAGYLEENIIFMPPPVDELSGALHCYTKVIWREKYVEE